MELKMEVYTPKLELSGILEVYDSVIWSDMAFSAGSFSIASLLTDETRRLLQPDNIVWIEGESAGIIEYFHEESGLDGPYISVKGKMLTGILDHNILWGQYRLSGTPPAIMRELVKDCCINPTRGDKEARKIPNLVLMDAPQGGNIIRMQKTGGTLLEALEQLGETYNVAFGVRFNPSVPQMEFWTRYGQDRGVHQAINPQVIFSRELDDILSSEYSYNSQDYRNVAVVAGEGEGDERTTVVVEAGSEEPMPAIKYHILLSVSPENGGTADGGGYLEAGESVTVTASPYTNFIFVGWMESGDVVSTDISYEFTVRSDRFLTAVFAAVVPMFTITASVDPEGSGTVTGTGQFQNGDVVTLTYIAADGYRFSGWYYSTGIFASSNNPYTFTADSNKDFKALAEEIPVYTITVEVSPEGAGTASGAGQYREGETVTLNFTVNDGYTFTGWQENGVTISTNATFTFTADGNREITALSQAIPIYVIAASVSPATAGTVTGAGQYRKGATVTLSITLNSGYTFTGWRVGGSIVSTNTTYTFTASASMTLIAAAAEILTGVSYYGKVTALSDQRYGMASAATDEYAIFAGGGRNNYYSAVVDAYDAGLTRTTPTELSDARSDLAGGVIGEYAVFAGGTPTVGRTTAAVDAYDSNLTRTTPTELGESRTELAAATVGDFLLFAGGDHGGGSYSAVVDAYDASLTRTTPTELSEARYQLAGGTIGSHAVFGGGNAKIAYSLNVDAYDASLTRTAISSFETRKGRYAAAKIGNYLLFAGGHNAGSTYKTIEIYDAGLTRLTPMTLSTARFELASAVIGNYALFAGGYTQGNGRSAAVDAFDTSLTHKIPTALGTARAILAGASIGRYALFAGGYPTTAIPTSVVEAYIKEQENEL